MLDSRSEPSVAIDNAFLEYNQQATFNNFRVACYLGILLMPLGTILDYFVYREYLPPFLMLRLLCSALIALFWGLVSTSAGQQHYRTLGIVLAMFPTICISVMIYLQQGALSPYYAGLNLVLLVVGFVLKWGFIESFVAVGLVILIYAATCLLSPHQASASELTRAFANNVYFLSLTGIIVVTGSYFHNKLRFREFTLRFELDRNQQELRETNQRLVELDQVKSRFFANISHELRTPLTLLLAPLDSLIQRTGGAAESRTQELLVTMRSNGMRLLKLINDLLDLVRLESGRLHVKQEPLELAEFIKGLASAARQVADDKRIQLQTSVGATLGAVLADRDKLEKVVLNLVFNALKFTPAGGKVEIRAELQQEHLVLTVSDTGMGIAAKNLPFIFDRFWQADTSSQRKYQGVGIGLALVKELVELQGGAVTVQSREGQGTVFTIRLPHLPAQSTPPTQAVQIPEEVEQAAEEPKSEEWLANLYRRAELFPALTPVRASVLPVETWSHGKRPRLLIADDEPDMLKFLKSQLEAEYQILEAVDGQQAIEKTSHFLPDVVLLDMMMPEKNGIEACRELRGRTPTQSIPIVLLTARADEATKMEALSAGASDFLTKPFSTIELHVRLKNLAESYDYQRKLARQNQLLERTIEQLKETESQLVESEKMRSLGQLSAGMIHEINNPLNFATTGLYTLRNRSKHLNDEHRAEYLEILDDVEEGVRRVRDLVSKMRDFSYADNQHLDLVEVAPVVESALHFLSHEWKGKVEIHSSLAKNQVVRANKNRLTQVLLNLLQNSIDALSRKTFAADKPAIWVEGRMDGEASCLSVRDNGSGIQPEHLDKVFDPFFTTKDVGQGMGLGLSICYRIVQDYGGRIHVRSEPGQSCEFRLEFPLNSSASAMQN